MTGGENTEMDNNQCKLEESEAVDTVADAANSKGNVTCEEGTSNPVITSSGHVDDDESDELDTVYDNEHDDEDDEATRVSTDQQQSGLSPCQSAEDAEDNNAIEDNTDEPVQL